MDFWVPTSVAHVQHINVWGLNLDNFIGVFSTRREFGGYFLGANRYYVRFTHNHVSHLEPNVFAAIVVIFGLSLVDLLQILYHQNP